MITCRVASLLLVIVFLTSTITGARYSFKRYHRYHRHHRKLTRYIENGWTSKAQELARAGSIDGDLDSYGGYFTVDKSTDSNMFFWYIPPTDLKVSLEEAPVILWLEGGPGMSSLFGAMLLNGPYKLKPNKPLVPNKYSWARAAHMLYIDNPVGVGFSYTKSHNGYSRNETHVGQNLYHALKQFFKLFPYLRWNSLIIAGESYAGKYVIALGLEILLKNPKAKQKLNLQGIAIGNGWVDPINMLGFGDVLYYNGLLDTRGRLEFNYMRKKVRAYIKMKRFHWAYAIYDRWILGETTPYPTLSKNLTGMETNYNFVWMGENVESDDNKKLLKEFFNLEGYGRKLNAGSRRFRVKNKKVAEYLRHDILKSVVQGLVVLLNNYRILIYNGQLDIKCAFALTEKYLSELDWSGKETAVNKRRLQWRVDGELAGYVKSVYNLTQVVVRNAGHMVPSDQAKWAMEMIYTFAYNLPFAEEQAVLADIWGGRKD